MCKNECAYISNHMLLGTCVNTFIRYTWVGPFLTPPTMVLHFHMTVVGWTLEALDSE